MPTIADFNALALAQVGVPYVFGGVVIRPAPNPGVDCSGLPYACSLRLGQNIPRTSEAQFAGLTPVSRAELRQGDLTFYNVPTDDQPQPAHVAIWWTPDTVLQAPRTGEDVGIYPNSALPYAIMGYRRLPFPSVAPKPPPKLEEMTQVGVTTAQNGDIVSTWVGRDGTAAAGHAFTMVQKAGTVGEPPTSQNTSIIDVTATWPFFQVQGD